MRIVNPGESSRLYGYAVCSLHPLDRGVAVVSLLLAFNMFAAAPAVRAIAPVQDGPLSLAAPESTTTRTPEPTTISAPADDIAAAFTAGAPTAGPCPARRFLVRVPAQLLLLVGFPADLAGLFGFR